MRCIIIDEITLKKENNMTKNVGSIDKIVRFVLGAVMMLAGLLALGGLSGNILGIVLAAVGAFVIFTAAVGWCPIWMALGINTTKSGEKK